MKLLLLITFFLTACLQQPPQLESDGELNSDGSDNSSTTFNDGPIDVQTTISWNENQVVSKTLHRSSATNKISYLFGDDLYNFLRIEENYNSNYCMLINFASSGSSTLKELRIKLTPSYTIDYTNNSRNYYLRAATSSALGNDFCNKGIQTIAPSGVPVVSTAPAAGVVANYVGDVCTNCSNDLTSQTVQIYKHNIDNNSLVEVTGADIATNSLHFILENSASSDDSGSGSTGSCTDSACNQQGFNCCVNGQCVNNKAPIKTTSEMTASELAAFNLAEANQATNSNWYLQYPNFYYICPNFVDDQTGDTSDGGSTTDTAAAELALKINDYYCINELETNSEITPFHDSPVNSSHTYTKCNTTDSSDEMYYQTVMLRLYNRCGCDDENQTLDEKINVCPKYTYKPEYEINSLGVTTTNILNVQCFAPPAEDDETAIKIIEVGTKSAPHRYFNTDGVEIDMDNNPNTITNQTQEGSPFIYLDSDFIFPQNGSFNMNSVLGQMYVNLDLAKPAKKIKVSFDKQYYLATLSGYYTPCPTCAKDSWNGQLSPHPSSGQGYGTQSVGYVTDRTSLGTNTSFGNYSDTHFGRACFVPPTMLPFSQKAYANPQTQRLNRLKTQAALFVNGYQKDWYGFNKGAMIGSFDGVTWFPIGNGRIVRSTSEYLYLAINAPFSDLAQNNNHVVSVQQWDGSTTATRFDFDPTKSLNSTYQNQGATCQENYMCEADKDCITKLGWEYTCQDVSSFRTKWPSFNTTTSMEVGNDARSGAIYSFLQQAAMPPGGNNKRCVYRGSGAVCRTDALNLSDASLKRQLSCAPNFYCAAVDSTSVFNKEVARFGAPLQSLIEANNHLFGKDADQLGRPKNYIASGQTLPIEIQNALKENVALMMDPADAATNGLRVGLCVPGRALPNSSLGNVLPSFTHDKPDPAGRTDYINQIAGCNSALNNSLKYASCPLIASDGNYHTLSEDFLSVHLYQAEQQNACGLESLQNGTVVNSSSTSAILQSSNAFSTVEANEVAPGSTLTVTTPTLAVNACLRRAGAVCHTDLDCSPNSKHSELIDIMDPSFFGNEAERKYWGESLVCAQGTKQPYLGQQGFNEYDMTNNRCCREIGQSISLYTQAASNINVDVTKFASRDPSAEDRYSRYSVLGTLTSISTGGSSYGTPSAVIPDVLVPDSLNNPNILTPHQWRTINETGKRTCCGGGFIRKFADGTNNWSVKRLNLDINNFACLNFKSPLPTLSELEAAQIDSTPNYYNDIQLDSSSYCSDKEKLVGGCISYDFDDITNLTDNGKPELNARTATVQVFTSPTAIVDQWNIHDYAFFAPQTADSGATTVINFENPTRRFIRVKIPSYIPLGSINLLTGIQLHNYNTPIPAGLANDNTCEQVAWSAVFSTDSEVTTSHPTGFDLHCGYSINTSTREMIVGYNDVLYMGVGEGFDLGQLNNSFASITYIAPGTKAWETHKSLIDSVSGVKDDTKLAHRRSSTPGHPNHYLKKLEKLELIGVPQVTYEPLYCNNNYQKLVPGIFKEEYVSVINVVDDSTTEFFDSGDSEKEPWESFSMSGTEDSELNKAYVSTKDALAHSEIFSSEEMMCCTPLGRTPSDASKCCSGFAATTSDDDPTLICKLPVGVDLNVYFNRFVSNEGTDPETTSAPLTEADFDPETGAPKTLGSSTSGTVLSKLGQLGADFCVNGTTRLGSAFGNYEVQAGGGSSSGSTPYLSIVDSFSDSGQNNNQIQGASVFNDGYKWNHHVYCN